MKRTISLFAVVMMALAISNTGYAETLQVWIMDPGTPETAENFFRRVNDDFRQIHPDVDVEVSFVPWISGQQKLITSIVGGMAPDVAELGTTWMQRFATTGSMLPVTDWLRSTNYYSELVPALLESATYQGEYFGAPWYAGFRAVIYRNDWFEEKGISKFPETWDDWIAVAKQLTDDVDNDGVIDRYGFAAAGNDWYAFLVMLWTAGGEVAVETDQGWRSRMNSPEAMATIDTWLKLYRETSPESSVTWDSSQTVSAFANGLVSMFVSSSNMIPRILTQNPDLEGKIGVAPVPFRVRPATFAGGSNLVVFKSNPNKEQLAKEYIEVMMRPEHQIAWAQVVNLFPARMDTYGEAGIESDPHLSVYGQLGAHSRTLPTTPAWGQIEGSNIIYDGIQKIMMGQVEPQAGLDQIAWQMDEIFATFQ